MGYPCSGVILAGGLSTRFSGRNKAFIEIGGIKILDRLYRLYRELFPEIILVTNAPQEYVDWDVTIVTDIFQERSSLTGIHAGLSAATYTHAFVAACDTPFLNRGLVEEVLQRIEPQFDIIIPKTREGFEPLCAVYARRCLAPMERSLSRDNFKIRGLFNKLKVRTVSEKVVLKHDPEKISFFNVNTPEDLEKAHRLHRDEMLRQTGEDKMDIRKMMAALKAHPDYADVGMVLYHNGVVRATSRDGRKVSGLRVAVDHDRLAEILREGKQRPGIVEILVEINEGKDLAVGDDVMLLAVAGDVRENVIETLTETLNAVKSTVTRKTEYFIES
ncbi:MULTISPECIES: NTP transferase domain-containing protein [Desulfococcus]|jgi:molybdopterin-guanine dinucleotide biosynthesis protein A|uniref:Probable molybdenum cofactor guanylyltransferase n=1 Tax=Desulfococcus multivorans DSM 2059 TaxID=1121405 RepID=S7UUT2_DESML|nr:NTP transferase domain-containing protein [Desulfococcus multivorans]AOY59678.1 MobA: molbdopterin-guanine dinucleotide biosynthesis protein A [Desulfococcus multivorans]AQX36469.1 hypothetical protein B2D07_19930 [Desulfococcus multivorans]EPR37834.1 Molybdopterin-guanine dinucleotide biosynthesis protein A [Desulfococcus multivorans DSM 2059]MDX9817676.1 NTP transferase domain-containing protein [Desulfococcus multivorans]SKA17143.1 Molybdopterin-guanine dinucleotide biosynthesis protein 